MNQVVVRTGLSCMDFVQTVGDGLIQTLLILLSQLLWVW